MEFDPQRALQAAVDVFWRKGYEATSLQDLLAAMDLSKSSFYQTFGSKRELFERCLELFRERQAGKMMKALKAAPSGRQFLRATLLSLADEARRSVPPKGCLIMNTATEFSSRDPAVAALVADGARAFVRVFRAAVVRAQDEGDIPLDKNADALANYLVATVSGLRTMVKAGMRPAEIEGIADVALRALE